MSPSLDGFVDVVTEHNLLVLVLMLVLTAGVTAGVTQLQLQGDSDPSASAGDTDLAETMAYVTENYGTPGDSGSSETRSAAVYVRNEENALSKGVLLDSLRYQRAVRERDAVATALEDRRIVGVANLVAIRALGDREANLDDQIDAIEGLSESELDALLKETVTADSAALRLLPDGYEPGSTTAESHRMIFRFSDDATRSAATEVLYETASDRSGPEYFTTGQYASAASTGRYLQNTMQLVVPAALLVILGVLAFSYRNLVDVIVGFTGVVSSVLWMFGILGWLQIPAGMSLIIGPVLIVGLSVDYGLHVFMRYREQRGPTEGIRSPMARGLSSVAVALAVVTLTAMVGFMSNATNAFTVIRELAFAITLGVLSTFVLSVTLVPALKVTIDRSLQRLGLDRRTKPLGKGGLLKPILATGAHLARRAAPVVLLIAVVAGAAGGLAWSELDRQSVQQGDGDVAEWKQELPGPLAWDVSTESRQQDYVANHYRAADESERTRSNILLEGSVTSPESLQRIASIHEAATDSDVVYQRGESVPGRSPVTLMASVAATDDQFAATLERADTDGDGIPDHNVESVYDALFETAPDRASQVIHREDGTYRSLRVILPIKADATIEAQAAGVRQIATAAEADDDVSTTAVGTATLTEARLAQTAESILETLLIALTAVGILLTLVYHLVTGSASLGVVTAVPITLVTALVIGGMWLAGVPLTLLTALLLSLVIGIGIDYNIHVSDRFAQERERGLSVQDSLLEATTGTGGALLGSTLTSAGAFSALLLHPHPQFQSFGTLVVLAMITAFVVAVFVLPSMIVLWARYAPSLPAPAGEATPGPVLSDD